MIVRWQGLASAKQKMEMLKSKERNRMFSWRGYSAERSRHSTFGRVPHSVRWRDHWKSRKRPSAAIKREVYMYCMLDISTGRRMDVLSSKVFQTLLTRLRKSTHVWLLNPPIVLKWLNFFWSFFFFMVIASEWTYWDTLEGQAITAIRSIYLFF